MQSRRRRPACYAATAMVFGRESPGISFVQTFYVQAYNPGGHFGFVKARGIFTMEGKDRITGHNQTFFIIGTDIANPVAVIPLGLETFEGHRILAELPSQ